MKLKIFSLALLVSCFTSAADFSSTNINYMWGKGYELGRNDKHILTLEHFSAHGLGDSFFFVDTLNPFSSTQTSLYGEVVLNWSSRKLFLSGGQYGEFLKDISLATSLEFSSAGAYLAGLAFDFNIPLFKVFRLTSFLRDEKNTTGSSFQLTWVWALPFDLGPTKWRFEGFLDLATGEAGLTTSLQTQPRLLVDIGALAFQKENTLWAGLEYQYWHNKFGITGVTESLPQYMVKWIF